MILRRLRNDTKGAALVEYTVTFPLFVLTIFGIIQAGLLLWAQVGLQHGVNMAARCASISDAAHLVGQTAATQCYSNIGGSVAQNQAAVQQYAAAQSFGLSPPASDFTFTKVACGNNVSASYPFNVLGGGSSNSAIYIFNLTLTAQACYPIPS